MRPPVLSILGFFFLKAEKRVASRLLFHNCSNFTNDKNESYKLAKYSKVRTN